MKQNSSHHQTIMTREGPGKVCPQCGVFKLLAGGYYRNCCGPYGYDGTCKDCRAFRSALKYRTNFAHRERLKAIGRAWRQRNPNYWRRQRSRNYQAAGMLRLWEKVPPSLDDEYAGALGLR